MSAGGLASSAVHASLSAEPLLAGEGGDRRNLLGGTAERRKERDIFYRRLITMERLTCDDSAFSRLAPAAPRSGPDCGRRVLATAATPSVEEGAGARAEWAGNGVTDCGRDGAGLLLLRFLCVCFPRHLSEEASGGRGLSISGKTGALSFRFHFGAEWGKRKVKKGPKHSREIKLSRQGGGNRWSPRRRRRRRLGIGSLGKTLPN